MDQTARASETTDQGPSSWGRLEIGARVGDRYRLVGDIGEGGMGHVYEAWDERESCMVALKVMSPRWTGNEVARKRFLREVEATRAVRHPNVVEVYDAGFIDDERLRPYLVMERLYGVSLWHHVHCPIQGKGPLDLELAVELMEQAADALQASHRAGVIHRDVKPENFHLTRSPLGAPVLKLLDFGLVRIQHGDHPKLTQEGTFVGTPEYMAPELALGEGGSKRTDVYGLASTFFELVTGEMPFSGENQIEVITKKRNERAPRLSEAAPDRTFPPEMEAVVACALARDPAARPHDPHELARELRLSLERPGSLPASPPPTRPEGKRAGQRAPRLFTPSDPERSRLQWLMVATLLLVALAIAALGVFDVPVLDAINGR